MIRNWVLFIIYKLLSLQQMYVHQFKRFYHALFFWANWSKWKGSSLRMTRAQEKYQAIGDVNSLRGRVVSAGSWIFWHFYPISNKRRLHHLGFQHPVPHLHEYLRPRLGNVRSHISQADAISQGRRHGAGSHFANFIFRCIK